MSKKGILYSMAESERVWFERFERRRDLEVDEQS